MLCEVDSPVAIVAIETCGYHPLYASCVPNAVGKEAEALQSGVEAPQFVGAKVSDPPVTRLNALFSPIYPLVNGAPAMGRTHDQKMK